MQRIPLAITQRVLLMANSLTQKAWKLLFSSFLLVTILQSGFFLSGCSEKKVKDKNEKAQIDRRLPVTFPQEVLYLKKGKITDVINSKNKGKDKTTVIYELEESTQSIAALFRVKAIENNLEIMHEYETARGIILIIGKEKREFATIAILDSMPAKVVVEHYSEKNQK